MRFLLVLILSCAQFAFADVALISVTGTAEKSVDPNMVNIQIEIWARSVQAKTAQETVAKEYQRVKSTVEKFKVKKEDFQTVSYNLSPEYNYDNGKNKIVGNRASHSILIILRNIEDAGVLVDAITSSKADTSGVNINSIAWEYDKREQVQMSLLGDAVKSTRAQADELAKASNSKIKRVYALSKNLEQTSVFPMRMQKFAAIQADAAPAPTDLSAGPVKIQVSVSAQYEIQ
jgi:uncharacterized protein YggE